MRHDNKYLKFGVYIHKCDKFIFIGSGLLKEIKSRHQRSKEHISMWDKLEKEWFVYGVSKQQARELQRDLLTNLDESEYIILNKHKKGIIVKDIKYATLEKYFYIDESSPTFLRWKRNKAMKKAGDIAGSLNISDGYYRVGLLGQTLQAYRVVYSLFNKVDINHETVIDHIDRNKSNNSPENLREVPSSINNRNLNLSNRNTTGVIGVYWENDNKICRVTWYEESCSKQKRLSLTPSKIFPNLSNDLAIKETSLVAKEIRQVANVLFYDKHVPLTLSELHPKSIYYCEKLGFMDKLRKGLE